MERIIAAFPAGRPVPASGLTAVNLDHLWAIYRDLRDARKHFNIGTSGLQVLQTMISFLRDGRGPVVFASNRTIAQRAGLDNDRTLRRQIARLVDAGLISRQDSPNGKRYQTRDPQSGEVISYGFTLAPMLLRADEIALGAEQVRSEQNRIPFLRKKLLGLLASLEAALPHLAEAFGKLRRRKLNVAGYEQSITEIEALLPCPAGRTSSSKVRGDVDQMTGVNTCDTSESPASDGQIVRHHTRSDKKDLDLIDAQEKSQTRSQVQTCHEDEEMLRTAITACSEAMAFALHPVRTERDLAQLAQELAPMMGIDRSCYDAACASQPWPRVAITVLAILQMGTRIRNMPAYFRSVMIGRRAASFDPMALLKRMSQQALPSAFG